MDRVRFGIVGLGNQGSSYMLNFFDKGEIVNGVVTAVCDINPKKLENIKAKTVNGAVAYFADYKDMLDSGLCDAVLVETPHYLHPEIVTKCLKRGIHAICEKPAGVYAKQVREMNEAAKKSNAKFAMMFNQRTNCVYRKMREIIASGGIGELQRVTWIITDWYRTQRYYDTKTSGGNGAGTLSISGTNVVKVLQPSATEYAEETVTLDTPITQASASRTYLYCNTSYTEEDTTTV